MVVLPRQGARHGWGLRLGNLCGVYARLHLIRFAELAFIRGDFDKLGTALKSFEASRR